MLVDLTISSLEDEFSDGFSSGISEGDIGLDSSDEVGGSLVDSHESTVVDLSESKNSKDSNDFGVKFVDTPDSDDEGQSGLGWYVDLSAEFGLGYVMNTCLRAVISAVVDFK